VKILDLCCGSGQTTRHLADRGFDVTGVDVSPALIALAKANAPHTRFEVADARYFRLRKEFHAAISLSDSLNHLLTIGELQSAFENVSNCLLPGGVFLFDLNLAHKYETSWTGSMAVVDEDAVCAVVSSADMRQKIAKFDAAVFLKTQGNWTRKDVPLLQTWYTPDEVTASLRAASFGEIRVTDRRGNRLPDWNVNKAYFSCSRA
jgi:SAM-dependent methyltransferase